jgi:DivIVA domain-containing protein
MTQFDEHARHEHHHLRHTRFRAGYAAEEVEPFVAEVEDALRSPQPRLEAEDVAGKRFIPVVLRHGYRMDDVDGYLDHAEHVLRERQEGSA